MPGGLGTIHLGWATGTLEQKAPKYKPHEALCQPFKAKMLWFRAFGRFCPKNNN